MIKYFLRFKNGGVEKSLDQGCTTQKTVRARLSGSLVVFPFRIEFFRIFSNYSNLVRFEIRFYNSQFEIEFTKLLFIFKYSAI